MKYGTITSLIVALMLTSGCARNNLLANRISAESYGNFERQDTFKEGDERSYARVFAWDSDYSAGMGNENGMCAQGALTARSVNYGATLEALVKKFDARALSNMQFAEQVAALNATSTQTSYANIGYFFVCQMMLNSMSHGNRPNFSNDQIVDMFKHVGDTAKELTQPAVTTATVGIPELKALRNMLTKQIEKAEGAEGQTTEPEDASTTETEKVEPETTEEHD